MKEIESKGEAYWLVGLVLHEEIFVHRSPLVLLQKCTATLIINTSQIFLKF